MGLFDGPLAVPIGLTTTFLAALLLLGMLQLAHIPHRNAISSNKFTEVDQRSMVSLSKSTPLSVSMKTKYTERDGYLGRHYVWSDGSFIAEPHLSTTFAVEEPQEEARYVWKLQSDGDDYIELTGPHIKLKFRHLHKYSLTVKEYGNKDKAGKNALREQEWGINVKYVRREVRQLFDEDVEIIFNALATLWKYDDAEGKKRFGERYVSMATLQALHSALTGAAAAGEEGEVGAGGCDHLDAGPGALAQHGALSLALEQALQAVDPRASLPYWDYARDLWAWAGAPAPAYSGFQEEGERWPFFHGGHEPFTSAYFGSTDPATGLIADGRWKQLEGAVRPTLACARAGALAQGAELQAGAVCTEFAGALGERAWSGFAAALSEHRYYQQLTEGMAGAAGAEEEAACRVPGVRATGTASSPEFWAVAPAVERLFHFKQSFLPFQDGAWPEAAAHEADRDEAAAEGGQRRRGRRLGAQAQAQEQAAAAGGASSEDGVEVWDRPLAGEKELAFCSGHNPGDTVLEGRLEIFYNGEYMRPTVAQMLHILDPQNANLPYLYDSFDFSYCDNFGVSIPM